MKRTILVISLLSILTACALVTVPVRIVASTVETVADVID